MNFSELQELYDRALENYRENKSDYDAGVCEGIKRVLEKLEDVMESTKYTDREVVND